MQFVVCACILLLIAFLKIISGFDMDSFGLNMINCLIAIYLRSSLDVAYPASLGIYKLFDLASLTFH